MKWQAIGLVALFLIAGLAMPVAAQDPTPVSLTLSRPGSGTMSGLVEFQGALRVDGAEGGGGGGGGPTNDPPGAVLSVNPNSGDAPLPVTFDMSALDDGSIVSWELDAGDGTPAYTGTDDLNAAPVQQGHTYATAGDYTATLTVTDDGGLDNSIDVTIDVDEDITPPPPTSGPPEWDGKLQAQVYTYAMGGLSATYGGSNTAGIAEPIFVGQFVYFAARNTVTNDASVPIDTSTPVVVHIYDADGELMDSIPAVGSTDDNGIRYGTSSAIGGTFQIPPTWGGIYYIAPTATIGGKERIIADTNDNDVQTIMVVGPGLVTESESPGGSHDIEDSSSDGAPFYEIIWVDGDAGASTFDMTIQMDVVPPATVDNPIVYFLEINGQRMEAYAILLETGLYDWDAAAEVPGAIVTFDVASAQVDVSIPRSYMSAQGFDCPCDMVVKSIPAEGFVGGSIANSEGLWVDRAPNAGAAPAVAPDTPPLPEEPLERFKDIPYLPVAPSSNHQTSPSSPPADPEITDGNEPSVPHTDIEAVWFDNDANHFYVGMKLADIPADPSLTMQTLYDVTFDPSGYSTNFPFTGTFRGLRVTALMGAASVNSCIATQVTPTSGSHGFYLEALGTSATGNNFNRYLELPDSSIDSATDIIWWVVPLADMENPDPGDELKNLAATTGVAMDGCFTLGGVDSASTTDVYKFKTAGPPPPNAPPSATLTVDASSGEAPHDVTFTLGALDVDGTIESWEIDLDGDTIADQTGTGMPPATIQHTFTEAGNYQAKLTVTDDDLDTGSDTAFVDVTEPEDPGGGGGNETEEGTSALQGQLALREGSCIGQQIITRNIPFTESGYYPFAFTFDTRLLSNGQQNVALCFTGSDHVPAQIVLGWNVQNAQRTTTTQSTPTSTDGPLTMGITVPASVKPGEVVRADVRIENPGTTTKPFTVSTKAPIGWSASPASITGTLGNGQAVVHNVYLRAPAHDAAGLFTFQLDRKEDVTTQTAMVRSEVPTTPFAFSVLGVQAVSEGRWVAKLNFVNDAAEAIRIQGNAIISGSSTGYALTVNGGQEETMDVTLTGARYAQSVRFEATGPDGQIKSVQVPLPAATAATEPTTTQSTSPGQVRIDAQVLETAKGVRVVGKVLRGGIPWANAEVTIQPAQGAAQQVVTDSFGSFDITLDSASDVVVSSGGVQRTLYAPEGLSGADDQTVPAPAMLLLIISLIGGAWALARRRD